MKREELLAAASNRMLTAWQTSAEDMGSRGADALIDAGMLVEPGGAAELERLRGLLNAQPVTLTEAQIEALEDAGNGALNDFHHEDQCGCSEYPEGCATDPQYRREVGFWDTAAFATGMAAVIGLWESMRADTAAEELGRLRARVAELEALKPAAIQTCRKCGAGYTYGEPCSTCLFQARMAAETQALREPETGGA